jgi:putative tricarboxylic transport membrane protein
MAMRARLISILPHSTLLLVAALLYLAALQIEAPVRMSATHIGPAAWPKFILGCMALLCCYEIIKRLFASPKAIITPLPKRAEAMADEDSVPVHDAPAYTVKLFTGFALMVGFVLSAPYLGFFAATSIFLGGFAWVGGFRKPFLAVLIAVVGATTLLLMFMRIAYVSLPLGVGPFHALSTLMLRTVGAL